MHNYSLILYQFLTFTQNLKQSQQRGKVFVPYPSILCILALQSHFANFIITSSTASVYLPCAISLLRKASKALKIYRRSSAVR